MRHLTRRALWRVNFVEALQLVGSARLPFGVPDPVLHGSAAIELYTDGLWSAADLDLYTLEPRSLIAELFGMGFRWAERPPSGGRGLWHPELQIGINIGSGGAPSDLAELSNVLTVINDLDLEQRAQASLKVIGIGWSQPALRLPHHCCRGGRLDVQDDGGIAAQVCGYVDVDTCVAPIMFHEHAGAAFL
jgi:hypothetical protein